MQSFEEFKQDSINRLEKIRYNLLSVIKKLENAKTDMEVMKIMIESNKLFLFLPPTKKGEN